MNKYTQIGIRAEIKRLYVERHEIDQQIREAQNDCTHPDVKKTGKGNGNYYYWYVCVCPDCRKRWSEDQ